MSSVLKYKPSAILVVGSETLSVLESAILLGKSYLCIKNEEHPCNKCKNCTLIEKNEHPDFNHLDTTSFQNDTIKINDISVLTSFFRLTSNQGGFRVFSLGYIERVNSTIQNSLLKILEEPPKNLKLVLFTKTVDSVPLTIKSRCQVIDLRRSVREEAEFALKKFENLDKKLLPILFKCEALVPSDAAKVCQNYEIEDIVDRLILWVHDVLLTAANCSPLVYKSYETRFSGVVKNLKSTQNLLESNHNLLEMKRYLMNNLNKTLFLEKIFMEFKNGFK